MSCKQNDKLYSLIHVLRDCSFCTAPADISAILSQMNKRRAHFPDNTPSSNSIKRLLADDPRDLRRNISDAEEFLSEEYTGFKDLLLFQIIRRWNGSNGIIGDDQSNTEQNTRKGLFHLTYRMPPDLVTADRNGKTPFVSEDEYQFQISARWQMILDLLSSLHCISTKDAAALTSVLSRTCTLGEIPLETPQKRNRESIDFSVLSRLTRHFQSAHKAASLPTPKDTPIPCMDIVVGRYDTNAVGSLHLVPGKTFTGYPVSTHFRDNIYYLSIISPEENGLVCHHLRVDHILDCAQRLDLPGRPLAELELPPEVICTANCHYAVTDCPESTLLSIIDHFGKHNISNSSHREQNGEIIWNFTISVSETQAPILRALHSEVREL